MYLIVLRQCLSCYTMSLLVYLCQLDQGQHDKPTQAAIAPAHNTADVTFTARHVSGKG